MSKKTTLSLVFGALLIAGTAPLAAPEQTYPGQPTQARVWIQNRGADEAVPVSVQAVSGDATMKVQVVGTPTVAIGAAPLLDTRRARQTWEYQRVLATPDDNLTVELNRLGREGWETALQYETARGGVVVILKRPR
jgi:hypothetical protein